MTTSPISLAGMPLSLAIAGELRAEMARRNVTQRQLAERMHKDAVWLGRRIGRTASVDITLEEVAEMADALGVDVEGIVVAALCACRDSNPKPSDLVLVVNNRLLGGYPRPVPAPGSRPNLRAVA